MRAEEGWVRELSRFVASFGVSQSLWWKRKRIAVSLLLGMCCGDDEKVDGFGILLLIEGMRI